MHGSLLAALVIGLGVLPAAAEPPTQEEALALAQELLDRLQDDNVDEAWLRAHLAPPPYGPTPASTLERWSRMLSPGTPVADRLRALPGPVAAVTGEHTQRVLLESAPGLSAVVRRDEGGAVRLQELAWTTCGFCTERVRFAKDLIEDVRRRGRDAHRLIPGADLDLDAHHAQHGVRETLIASISLRNGQGGVLPVLLRGAKVVGESGERVDIRYADGTLDSWTIRWRDGRWRVDYASLPEASPLRLPRGDEQRWSEHRVRAQSAREGWQPSFRHDGAGLILARDAIGAWPDPRDGTVLVMLRDVDKALAAIIRIDPETRSVIERFPGPALDVRTQLPLENWLGRWPSALSPNARFLAMTGPNRLWTVDLETGRSRTVARGSFDWVGFVERDRLWAARGTTLFEIEPSTSQQTRRRLSAPPVGFFRTPTRTTLIDAQGRDVMSDPSLVLDGGVCCGDILEAIPRASASATLLTCGSTCGVRQAWVDDDVAEPIPGVDQAGRGASCSPDGQAFTSPSAEGLSLRLPGGSLSIPAGPVRHTRWVDAEHLLTIGMDGRVIWWDLGLLRRSARDSG